MIHLDTNFVIRGLQRGTAQQVAVDPWVAAGRPLEVSPPAWAEFLCGPILPQQVRNAVGVVGAPVPFDADAAMLAAELFNHAGRRRGSILAAWSPLWP